MKHTLTAMLVTLSCLSCSSETSSPTGGTVSEDLYAAEFNQFSDSVLYVMDTGDGEVEKVGDIPVQITDIAGLGGLLYGVSFSSLYLIDQVTGNASFRGATGYPNVNALASYAGELYAATTDGDLLTLDTFFGTATPVGPFGFNITSSGDLAFDAFGQLYATVDVFGAPNDRLALIDVGTGAATIIGDTGFDEVFGIAFFDDELYGVLFNGTLVRFNTATGAATTIGQGQSFKDRVAEFTNSNALNIGGLTAR